MSRKFKFGDLLTVSKSLIVTHSGIYVGNGRLIDNSGKRGSVGYRSIDDFADGKEISVIQYESKYSRSQVVARAETRIGKPYKLWSQNCEHFTNEVLFDSITSKQAVIGGILLLVAAAYLLNKKG
ncbi:MAG: hypothetical protein GQ535_02485 [Rhodobacteraceae bacterium]|nr:hypothetical protein [Paracoccaceae bacterium]